MLAHPPDRPLRDDSALPPLVRIYWRWQRQRRNTFSRAWWLTWTLPRGLTLSVACFLFLLLWVESTLWTRPFWWDDRFWRWLLGPHPPAVVARNLWLLLPILVFNGWLIDRLVAVKTERTPGWARRLVRVALASLPVLGLTMPALWRPGTAVAARSAVLPPLPAAAVDPRLRGRWLADRLVWLGNRWIALGGLPWTFVTGFVAAFLALLWWTSLQLAAGRRGHVLALCVALHVLLAGLAAWFHDALAKTQSRPLGSWVRWSLLLWLLPLPVPAFGLWILFSLEGLDGAGTIAGKLHARRRSLRQLPVWDRLQTSLSTSWHTLSWSRRWFRPRGEDKEHGASRAELQLRAFYRLKCLLLVLDLALLLWLATLLGMPLGGPLPLFGADWPPLLSGVFWLALALAAGGLVVQVVGFGGRIFQAWSLAKRLEQNPWGTFLLLSSLACVMGFQVAFFCRVWDPEALLLAMYELAVLTICLSLAIFLSSLSLGGPPRQVSAADWMVWSGLFLVLTGAVGLLALDEDLGLKGQHLVRLAVVASPLWNLGLGLLLGPWLLRPFGWRDVLRRDLPRAVRYRLRCLAVTALVPLGGLVVPVWILLRPQLAAATPPQGPPDGSLSRPAAPAASSVVRWAAQVFGRRAETGVATRP